MGERVQIPAYTDRWMMGDRFGEIVKTTIKAHGAHLTNKVRTELLTGQRHGSIIEIAHVKLDKSGKIVRVILADCEVV